MYSTMISQEKMVEEYIKCFNDKTRIYFIENYFKTFDASVGAMVPFKLFPKQKEYLINCSEHSNVITVKPRQSGFSSTTAAFIAANLVFASIDAPEVVLIIANKLDMSKDDLKKIKGFIDQTPRWFFGEKYYHPNPDYIEPDTEVNPNKRPIYRSTMVEMECKWNNSILYARSSGPNASRGVSACSYLFFDEAAFIERGEEVAASAIATTASVKNKHIFMVSTPNLKDKLYYETYRGAELGTNDYKITYLRWYHDPRFNKNMKWWKEKIELDENGEETKTRIWEVEEVIAADGSVAYNPDRWKTMEGLGWHAISPWYIDYCNSVNNNSIKIAQELECSFIGSGNVAVDPQVTEMQRNKNVSEEYKTDMMYPEMRIWKMPIPGHRYILSADASRGNAGDNSSIEIIDIDAVDERGNKYLDQVAEFEGKLTGDIVGNLAYKYGTIYNNALITVDCIGGWGESITLTLLQLGYKNLYYEIVSGKDYMLENQFTQFTPDNDGRLPGFHAKSARTFMISSFIQALTNNLLRIRSNRVISELETWIVKSSGKIEHAEGCHDDTLTNLSMAMFVYENSFLKLKIQQDTDAAILKAFAESTKPKQPEKLYDNNIKEIHPSHVPLPFFKTSQLTKPDYPYAWVTPQR